MAQSPGVTFKTGAPFATSFPEPLLTSASFNRSLYHSIGTAIGVEVRAFANQRAATWTVWTPNINIFRDPRWGRGQETPGEDPYLNGQYAARFVSGLQSGPDDPERLRASAACKHLADYNIDHGPGYDRNKFDAVGTKQDMLDTFLPPFESCVRDGRASGLMCSYNAINGVPSCANKDLLTAAARDRWGLEGYVTSDCGAVFDVHYAHHYTNTTDATCRAVLDAGLDLDCGSYLGVNLPHAVSSGAVSERMLDDALKRLFGVRMRLGEFDAPDDQPYLALRYATDVDTPTHRALALEAAQQGIVLLVNRNLTSAAQSSRSSQPLAQPAPRRASAPQPALPLSAASLSSVACIGPAANSSIIEIGNYFGRPSVSSSVWRGVRRYVAHVTYAAGCADVACRSTAGFGAAATTAASADVTLLVLGLDQSQEGEGHDRTELALPGQQQQLAEKVLSAAAGKPVVVVLLCGGPVDVRALRDDPRVSAIVWGGYGGQAGGDALADVLFGTVSPSGRLPVSWMPAEFAKRVPPTATGMRPNATLGHPGHTYRFYNGTGPGAAVCFPFGRGLSYTAFRYDLVLPEKLSLQPAAFEDEALLGSTLAAKLKVNVTNVGARAAADAVLAFARPPSPGVGGAPLKSLVGFDKVWLEPGESAELSFPLSMRQLGSVAGNDGRWRARQGTWAVLVGRSEITILVT